MWNGLNRTFDLRVNFFLGLIPALLSRARNSSDVETQLWLITKLRRYAVNIMHFLFDSIWCYWLSSLIGNNWNLHYYWASCWISLFQTSYISFHRDISSPRLDRDIIATLGRFENNIIHKVKVFYDWNWSIMRLIFMNTL